MRSLRELLDELDMAAATTKDAQIAYVGTVMDALEAEERLKDYEAEVAAEAADKERHPELKNEAVRKGFIMDSMNTGVGENYRLAHHGTLHNKLLAQAKYDYYRRREADLRVIVSALKPEK